jgi:hypothetical protein
MGSKAQQATSGSGWLNRTAEVGRTGARFGPAGSQQFDADAAVVEPVPEELPEDVGLTGARFGPASLRRPKRSGTAEPTAQQPPDGTPEPGSGQEAEPGSADPSLRSESDILVRPYARTGGRTRPARDLAIEALICTRSGATADTRLISTERQAIVTLCVQPRSVAEVAALLSLPLGVARVLLGDLADDGVVEVHQSAGGDGVPDLGLMQRVLAGLRRL